MEKALVLFSCTCISIELGMMKKAVLYKDSEESQQWKKVREIMTD